MFLRVKITHNCALTIYFSRFLSVFVMVPLKSYLGTSLVAQWLNPPANAGDTGSIPGLGRSHMPRSN